jgi:hypothetical protein
MGAVDQANMTAENDLKQLVKERRYVAAFKALQNRTTDRPYPRGSFDELWDDMGRLRRAGTPFAAVAAIFGALLLIVAVLVVGLTAGGLRIAEWTLFPAVDRLFTFVVSNVFRPGVLPALALTVLVLGLPWSRRFRSPSLFATGVIFTSLGLICFWLFPVFIGVVQRQCPPEAELPLVIVGGVMSLLAFVVGLQLMGQANR